jgi:AcrR family transcriptional regulator
MVGEAAVAAGADRGQRSAPFQRARSHETKRMLVRAAVALWRTTGYASTTVAEICTTAGVSKALFYFRRKEDVLFEVGVMSRQAAHRAIHDRLAEPYGTADIVTPIDGFHHRTRHP